MWAVLNGVKCAVINGKCAVINGKCAVMTTAGPSHAIIVFKKVLDSLLCLLEIGQFIFPNLTYFKTFSGYSLYCLPLLK